MTPQGLPHSRTLLARSNSLAVLNAAATATTSQIVHDTHLGDKARHYTAIFPDWSTADAAMNAGFYGSIELSHFLYFLKPAVGQSRVVHGSIELSDFLYFLKPGVGKSRIVHAKIVCCLKA